MEIIFWVSFTLILYTYIGYGVLVTVLSWVIPKPQISPDKLSGPVTVIIPGYNEATILPSKVQNTLEALREIPGSEIIVITDGSDDGSENIVFNHPAVKHLHQPERKGKSAAINRAMEYVSADIVVITDANAMINPEAIRLMVTHYQRKKTGGVSGEKRVLASGSDTSASTEGLYWKYESYLKKKSAEVYTVVGAAGELFSFRRSLFRRLEEDAILDDFVLSLRIVRQGYRIAYEPGAYASELPSKNIADEFERKVRISSGVWQTLGRLPFLFNPFFNPVLFGQFISHRFLRWTLAPVSMVALYVTNIFLLSSPCYALFFIAQSVFYLLAAIGFLFKNNTIRSAALFVPFYFCMMNVAVLAGLIKYLKGGHSVLWKKAQR